MFQLSVFLNIYVFRRSFGLDEHRLVCETKRNFGFTVYNIRPLRLLAVLRSQSLLLICNLHALLRSLSFLYLFIYLFFFMFTFLSFCAANLFEQTYEFMMNLLI